MMAAVFENLLVGAGIGEGVASTYELHVKNYKQAMASPDQAHWLKE